MDSMSNIGICVIFLLVFTYVSNAIPYITVEADRTKFLGMNVGEGPQNYRQFLGIRYGKAPEGERRFVPTEMADLPAEVKADRFGSNCFPVMGPTAESSEDCLFLNIYCPPLQNSTDKHAVIVFIHGGGNIVGNSRSMIGGRLAAEHDVIVVTFNYRLGPLGFLSTLDGVVKGNAGFWDQNLLLRWVQRYIGYFGGDVHRITLYGSSAGAKATSLHTVSPKSKLLFRRAIMQSGTVYGPSFYAWDALDSARRLARRVGCPDANTTQMVECLYKVQPETLSSAGNTIWLPDQLVRGVLTFGWGAVLDGDFLPKDITPGLFTGEVLLGLNNNEGSLLKSFKLQELQAFNATFVRLMLEPRAVKTLYINQSLVQSFEHSQPTEAAVDATYDIYIKASTNGPMPVKSLMDMYADQQYIAPAIHYLRQNITSGDSYLYFFDRYLPQNMGQDPDLKGSRHVDDSRYTFGQVNNPSFNFNASTLAKEERFSRALMIYVSNFAKTGYPNMPVSQNAIFKPFYGPNNAEWYLHIDDGFRSDSDAPEVMKSNLFPARMKLWLEDLPRMMKLKTDNSDDDVDDDDDDDDDDDEKEDGLNGSTTVMDSLLVMLITFVILVVFVR